MTAAATSLMGQNVGLTQSWRGPVYPNFGREDAPDKQTRRATSRHIRQSLGGGRTEIKNRAQASLAREFCPRVGLHAVRLLPGQLLQNLLKHLSRVVLTRPYFVFPAHSLKCALDAAAHAVEIALRQNVVLRIDCIDHHISPLIVDHPTPMRPHLASPLSSVCDGSHEILFNGALAHSMRAAAKSSQLHPLRTTGLSGRP